MASLNKGLIARDKNGLPISDIRIDAAYGELFIDDATGFVSAATPAAEKVDAAPVTVGRLNNVTADAAERVATTLGQLTCARNGDYQVQAHGTLLGGNASVMKIEVFKNNAVVADAAGFPGGSIKAELKMQATAAQESFAISPALLPDLKIGDTVDLRVTGSVGTVTIKQLRFSIAQISDADAPVFA